MVFKHLLFNIGLPGMKYLAVILLVFACYSVSAQELPWQEIDARRVDVTTTGMYVLGAWAVGNLVVNPILASRATGADKSFYQMSTMWNVVNLGLAGASLWQSSRGNAGSDHWLSAFNEQHSIEKIFLINAALDVAYMAGGLYMMERSKNVLKNSDRLKGFGKGVMVQGAFLFVFDLAMYGVLHGNQKDWARILQNVNLGPEGVGMIIPLR